MHSIAAVTREAYMLVTIKNALIVILTMLLEQSVL